MNKKNNDIKDAIILEIIRMSTEDGPGLRTSVFFKGCNLKCIWCHNPESIKSNIQIQWIDSRCIGCKTCINTCPENALSLTELGIEINRNKCKECLKCANNCPSTAIEQIGYKWSLEDLTNEVLKDKAYFKNSIDGGITATGGEPTLQAKFVSSFFKQLKKEKIHTALDTCGMFSKSSINDILPYTDLILFDIKEIDPDKHKKFTGYSNEKIIENLIYLSQYINDHKTPKEIWIRTPIIPDTTARFENINGIGKLISSKLNGMVTRWELCSFNNYCKDKYIRLGINWHFKNYNLLSKSFMEQITDTAKKSGVDPNIVNWKGSISNDQD